MQRKNMEDSFSAGIGPTVRKVLERIELEPELEALQQAC